MNSSGDALYFSRAPIPPPRTLRGVPRAESRRPPVFKQVGVIRFVATPFGVARLTPTALERAESIDMLRVIEHAIAFGW